MVGSDLGAQLVRVMIASEIMSPGFCSLQHQLDLLIMDAETADFQQLLQTVSSFLLISSEKPNKL